MNKELFPLNNYIQFKLLSISFLSILMCLDTVAQEQLWSLPSPHVTGGELIATDEQGNIYLTAYFEKEIELNDQTLFEGNGRYLFIKYKSNQEICWFLQLKHPIEDLQVQQNHIFLFGHFKGQFEIDDQILKGDEYYQAFVTKLTSYGQLLWAKQLRGGGDVLAKEMTIDPEGNAYICGNFEETAKIGDTTLYKNRKKNIYIAKYDSLGKFCWARQASGGQTAFTGVHVWGVSWDITGHLLVMGNIAGQGVFGKTKISSSKEVFAGEGYVFNSDIFLARYDPQGNLKWVKNIAQNAEAQDMLCTDNGSIYLTGYFEGNRNPYNVEEGGYANFDGKRLKAALNSRNQILESMFIAKYSPLGNLIWVKRTFSSQNNRGISIASDKKNKYVYIAGYFAENLNIHQKDTILADDFGRNTEVFLSFFQGNGKYLSLEKAGGFENDYIMDSCVDHQGRWLLTGRFKNTIKSGSSKLKSNTDKYNAFILMIKLLE